MTAADYLAGLKALLPPGPAWPRDDGSVIARELDAAAQELARLDARAAQLVEEADPRTTGSLLLDWERVAGLPDGCVADAGVAQSVDQRRAALVARLTQVGGQSPAYFVALAAAMGYPITITEFPIHTFESSFEDALNDEAWAHVWQVNAALASVFELSFEDGFDDPWASWSNVALECVFNRFKPAHTRVIFAYI